VSWHFVSVINPLTGKIMKRVSAMIGGAAVLLLAASAAIAEVAPAAAPTTTAATANVAGLKAGAPLRDSKGAPVGTIVSASEQAVVIDTGQTKIGVPLSFFSKDDKGPMLTVTADQFNEAVAKAHARAEAAKAAQPQAQAAQDQKPH
jgi:autotransporter adhesin